MQLDSSGRPVGSDNIHISIVLDGDGAQTLGQSWVYDGEESHGQRQQQLHVDNTGIAVLCSLDTDHTRVLYPFYLLVYTAARDNIFTKTILLRFTVIMKT